MKKHLRKGVILAVLIFIGVGGFVLWNLFGKGEVTFVKANSGEGFACGYYYYIPQSVHKAQTVYILVEPNNTGFPSEEETVFKNDAKNTARSMKSMAEELGCILLVPTFARPQSDELMYTHALDRDTLQNNTGTLARVDLQLIKMVENLRNLCAKKGLTVEPKILMDGFSASGTFVNRFVALHPAMVKAAVAGGVNGMPILPLESLDGEKLIYPVGTADIEAITGTAVDLAQVVAVPQMIYMGALDDNDTLPYDDAFSQQERDLILRVLGQDMQLRWQTAQQIYKAQGANATFTTYAGTGHEVTDEIKTDKIRFLKDHMDGK